MNLENIDNIDIVVLTEDPNKSSGYSVNGRLISWALAEKWDTVVVGEGTSEPMMYDTRGRDFPVIPCEVSNPSDPRNAKMGQEVMHSLLNEYNPDVVVTIVDPHRVSYLHSLHNPVSVSFPIRNVGEEIEKTEVMKRFSREISQVDTEPSFEWVSLIPIDGQPAPESWKPFIEEVDYAIAAADYGMERMKKDYNLTPYKIPHAVDYRDVSAQTDDTFLIGTVNRNQFRKHTPRLIESWGKFYNNAGRPDDVEFYIHSGYDDNSGWLLDKYLKKYDIEDAVRDYEGYVSRERLMEIYSEFDIFCSATGGEGFGLTTIESMAQGTPVLITDYTTSEELVVRGSPSPRGKLVDVKTRYDELPQFAGVERALVDVDDFADKISSYYNNPERVESHGENARRWVMENHSWENVANQWVEFMENVVFD